MLLTLILTLTLSHYLTLSLFLTLTLFQSLIESLLTCWTTFVFISMLKSHSHTLTLSLSHTLSLSLSHSLNLSFNHSRHAEQVLFSCLGSKVAVYSRKLQCFFFDTLTTLPCYFRDHRAGSQLKIISIAAPQTLPWWWGWPGAIFGNTGLELTSTSRNDENTAIAWS